MQMFKASRHDATYWICSITVFQLRDIACGSRCLTCDWEDSVEDGKTVHKTECIALIETCLNRLSICNTMWFRLTKLSWLLVSVLAYIFSL
jgi:hypothetical protein